MRRPRYHCPVLTAVGVTLLAGMTPPPVLGFELATIGNHHYRWHETTVAYYINPTGYPLAAVDPDFEYIQAAFEAWQTALGADAPDFHLVHAGATWGADSSDGRNTITFEDPDLDPHTFAATSVWIDTTVTMSVNGVPLARIVDTDIRFREEANLGPGCWRWGTPDEATGLECEASMTCLPPFAPTLDLVGAAVHEVGHVLGLGHEQDIPGVTMRARSRNEAVCDSTFASLAADDIAGAEFLYVDRVTPGATNVRLTEDPGSSIRPRVAIGPDGNVAVVWQDDRHGNQEIFWQKFTLLGVPITPVVRVTDTPEDEFRPDIDMDATGTSHVVWQEDSNLSGVGEVVLCRLDPAGTRVLDDVVLGGAAGDPRVSALDAGATDITWRHFETTNQNVYYRRYDASGAMTCERSFNAGTIPGIHKRPVVTTRQSDGLAVIHWADLSTTFYDQIREAMVNASCGVSVASHNIMQGSDPMCPSITHNGSFLFMVFERNGDLFNYQGTNSACKISQGSGTAGCPSIDADASNGFATWSDTRDGNAEIYFCRFWGCTNRTGDVRLTVDGASSEHPDIAVDPAGASLPQGRWAIVWQDERDGNAEIYLASSEVAVGAGEGILPLAAASGIRLLPNAPNPFATNTIVRFVLPGRAHTALRVYDVRGRMIRSLFDGTREAGRHEATWNGRDSDDLDVPSGVYFLRLTADGQVQSRKAVLLR